MPRVVFNGSTPSGVRTKPAIERERIWIAGFLTCGILTSLLCYSLICFADITLKSATQLTIGTKGEAPTGSSGSPRIASNGQIAVFNSNASNLVADDANGASDVFAANLSSGAVTRLSVNAAGEDGENNSTNPCISMVGPDGFYAAAFESTAGNLGTGLSTVYNNIHVRIPSLNITERISRGVGDTLTNDDSVNCSIAYLPLKNKIRVAFASDATNLVSTDQNGARDIFLAEINIPTSSSYNAATLATITWVTKGPSNFGANAGSDNPVLSANGDFLVFESRATNIISGLSPSANQVYLYDIVKGTFSLVSKSSAGDPGDRGSSNPTISFNGRYISYLTDATNIITGLGANITRVIRYDTKNGTSELVSSSAADLAGDKDAQDASISSTGRFVTFSDSSSNLVTNDTNGLVDTYLKDMETGDIIRVSQSRTGDETDGASDSTFSGTQTFNSLTSLISFRTFASNIGADGLSSGAGDIFISSADLALLPFTKTTRIEVPADVVPGRKKATFTFQKFDGFTTQSNFRFFRASSSATKTVIQYEIKLDKTGKKKERTTLISKRNRLTQRKLKPGTYTSQYRVVAKQGTKTVAKTPFSPKTEFTVS